MNTRMGGIVCLIVFLLSTGVQGCAYLLNIGPLTMPDPGLHAVAPYALATGQTLNPVISQRDQIGNIRRIQPIQAPASLIGEHTHARNATVTGILYTDGSFFSRDEQREQQYQSLTADATFISGNGRSNQYPPLAYLPQSIGMRVALNARRSMWTVLQWGRYANLLAFMIAAGTAILLAGRARWMLCMVGMNPVSVFCASSLMGDATLIAAGMLTVGLFIRLLDHPDGRFARLLPIPLGVLALLFATKIVYLPLLVPFLAVPSRHSVLRRFVTGLLVLLPALVLLAWWSIRYQYVPIGLGVKLASNRTWIVSHPIRTMIVISANMLAYVQREPFSSMLSLLMPVLIALFFLYARRPVVLPSGGEAERSTRRYHRRLNRVFQPFMPIIDWASAYRFTICTVLSCALSLGLMFGSLLVTWTPTASLTRGIPVLPGFQERYLWPLLPLLALPAWDARRDRQKNLRKIC
ncbi:DUF2142 domain-containing protein [Bifidobacterium biavatii]|uniref:Membrane protein, PF09913 family n=1 Tax=Bifidobacterium biavatii DSM 23969 TaxID=1437608 RepID=A0A086ZDA6_9BIFI|nr:DUF2142 domain-containing protein [Bifidobacterium biavatii]KFI44506.1 membrane protein, PF09913 family [Bifidobacterium biavatii DSM 23969]